MRTPRALALAVAGALATLAFARPIPAWPAGAGPVRAPEATVSELAGAETGIEHFALYAPATGHERGHDEVLALVEWRRRGVHGGLQLQRDVRFVEQGRSAGRVVHVERLTERDARLSWREIGSASGRTLDVEWTRDGRGLQVHEWGRDGARRVRLEAWKGVALPLYLIELARSGGATQGDYVTFDPLGRRLEGVVLRTSYSMTARDAAGPTAAHVALGVGEVARGGPVEASTRERGTAGATRTVEALRRDGTLAGRYVFRGTELVEFRLQSGGPVARRISRETYGRLLAGLREADAAHRESALGTGPEELRAR